MSDALTFRYQHPDTTQVLNPDIPKTILSNFDYRAACCMLQLSELRFPRIGSLAEDNGVFDVAA